MTDSEPLLPPSTNPADAPRLQSSAPPSVSTHVPEKTFKSYTSTQASAYAAHRQAYPPALINLILDHHRRSGGKLDQLLDVACGPGTATAQLSPHFREVVGCDASAAMIETARSVNAPLLTGASEKVRFEVADAGSLHEIDGLAEQSVDMVTVATAAHWFDMPAFWTSASRVLKPGGHVALWCGGTWYADPRTLIAPGKCENAEDGEKRAKQIQDIWTELEVVRLGECELPGNRICRELYADLVLPWDSDTATSASWDKDSLLRIEFNADGRPEHDKPWAGKEGYLKNLRVTIDQMKKMLSTASPVTRWREKYKEELERGDIEDCVEWMRKATREKLSEVEEGRDWVDCGCAMVLIMVRKGI